MNYFRVLIFRPATTKMKKLEIKLYELRTKEEDLFKDYEEVKSTASKILNYFAIPWYPDHGVTHSARLIERITAILALLPQEEQLTREELFTLLCACYLHDIGMGYLKIKGRTHPYDKKDYELIRTRHPAAGSEQIEKNLYYLNDPEKTESLKIPSQYARAVSLVVKAHGTDYFLETLPDLEKICIHSDASFRGPLVAALLLMGDELELDSRRVEKQIQPQAKWADYPPESLLHIYRHHYILAAKVRRQDGRGRISLDMQFPHDSSGDPDDPDSSGYAEDIIFWVAGKLREQCRLTGEIFARHGLIWAPEIDVYRHKDHHTRIRLPKEARPVLAELTGARQVVNREALMKKLQKYARGYFPASQALLIRGEQGSDQQTLAEWFQAACRLYPESTSHDFIDFTPNDPYHIHTIVEKIRHLRAGGKKAVCILQNLQEADKQVMEWLAGKGLAQVLCQDGAPPVFLAAFADVPTPSPGGNHLSVENLNRFLPEQVRLHLVGKLGCSESQARDLLTTLDPAILTPGYIAGRMKKLQLGWVNIIHV